MQDTLQQTFVHSFLGFSHPSPSNSFQALDAYIQSQKALLARTQSDLDRLRRIRDQAVTHPDLFFDSLDEKVFFVLLSLDPLITQLQLNDSVFHLDRKPDIAAEVQDQIDWDLFKGQGVFLRTLPLLNLCH